MSDKEEAVTFNAADPSQVRERGRKDKREIEKAQDDLRAVLALPQGRRFLWRLLATCGTNKSSFHPSGQVFAHNEGRRSVGVEVMVDIIEADPQAWIGMQQERLDAERKGEV